MEKPQPGAACWNEYAAGGATASHPDPPVRQLPMGSFEPPVAVARGISASGLREARRRQPCFNSPPQIDHKHAKHRIPRGALLDDSDPSALNQAGAQVRAAGSTVRGDWYHDRLQHPTRLARSLESAAIWVNENRPPTSSPVQGRPVELAGVTWAARRHRLALSVFPGERTVAAGTAHRRPCSEPALPGKMVGGGGPRVGFFLPPGKNPNANRRRDAPTDQAARRPPPALCSHPLNRSPGRRAWVRPYGPEEPGRTARSSPRPPGTEHDHAYRLPESRRSTVSPPLSNSVRPEIQLQPRAPPSMSPGAVEGLTATP